MRDRISAGDLRHRIVIERQARSSDGAGGADVVWQQVADVAAAIWPRMASEQAALDRVAGTATHDVWIRHLEGVRPDMRMRLGPRIFDIRGVIDVEERHRWLKCIVEERDL